MTNTSRVPYDCGHYLMDIQACLLSASAANEAMIDAQFTGDVAALAQACGVVLAETMGAANRAVMLGHHLSAHRRRQTAMSKELLSIGELK